MTKRILSVFLVMVMIFTVLPAEAFAANGTNLGWEYAIISEKRNSSGKLTGYNLSDPSGSNHLGQYVTVTYVNGSTSQTMTEGSKLNSILSSSSTGYIDITCSYGYYIAWIVLCCGNNGRRADEPFNCRTVGTEDAYGLATADSIPTHVRLNISDLYANANHDSNDDSYYLMIQLEPIPTPAYVVYDAGKAGSTDISAKPVNTSVSITDPGFQRWLHTATVNPALEYSQGATAYSAHTVLDISEAAEAEANAIGAGYSFAGWQAEYYRYYNSDTNAFTNLLETGSGYDQPGDSVTLYTYVKMTAIWQPKENITVTKVWDDNNNQDGLRPSSVTVYLVSNGTTEVDSAVLSDANNWTHTWTVPANDVYGANIAYAVSEAVPTGYMPTVTGSETAGFIITNTHTPEKVDIHVNKIWVDSDNQDGIRPDSIEVHLLVNGEHLGHSLILSEANNWSGSWTGLNKYAGGTKITYVVAEEAVNGYTPTYERVDYNVNITNTHNSELVSMTVQKYWNDAANQDGIRPGSVTIQLLANGEAYGSPMVLNASNNWYHTFSNLPKYSKGVAVTYTAEEISVPDGYSVSYNYNSATSTYEVTNTHVPETVDVSVSKVWSDNDDQDGIRPASITVALYKDGIATGANAVLNAANGWSYTFKGVAKNTAGAASAYTVREVSVPAGYTVNYEKSVDANGNTGCTITNTHVPEITNLTVSKVWEDANNQDGKRPASISVSLYANGVLAQTVELNAAGNWAHTFSGMAVYSGGQKISYTVTEVVPAGYTSSINGLVITNSYKPETIDLTANKVWDDNDDQDGKRPYAVVLTLYKNGVATQYSVTVTAGNGWSGKWTGMPVYENGHVISYSVAESGFYATKADMDSGNLTPGVPEGYSVDHSYDHNTFTATVTNTYEPESTFVNIQKHWEDANDQDGIRPDSIVVILYKTVNGVKSEVQRVTLNDENEWDVSVLHLPRYENGEYVNYSVEEVVPAGYTAQYRFDNVLRIVYISNVHTPATVNIPVRKVWNDNNNQDGKRNDSVIVRLYANGVATNNTVTLSESNGWAASFQNVPKYAQGEEITYTLAEDNLMAGYTAEVTGSVANGFVITNTYDPETTSVTVSKVWNDGDNQDNTRPNSITVNLLADGVVVDSMEMNPGNLGIITFQNLPKFNNGREIVYTVAEVVPAQYTASYSGNAASGFIITNSYETKSTSLSVNKVWDDNDNQDGLRPSSVVVYLAGLGGEIIDSVTLSAANGWAHTWTDLDMYANGTLINYTVREENVAEYTVNYTRNGNRVTITNSYRAAVTSVTVQKVWRDENNQDGKRPASVQIALLANNMQVATVILSEENNWKYTWSDLKLMSGGTEIKYSVRELNVPAGYTSSVITDKETGVIEVINRYETVVQDIIVKKIWDDMDNIAGIRPEKVLIHLYRDGAPTNRVVWLSEENNWTHVFKDLNVYSGGKKVLYHAMEVNEITGYTVSYGIQHPNIVTITNTHIPELTSVSVTKIWMDSNNQDGIRPASIKVNLYADGVYVSSLELSAENHGKIVFTDLLKSRDGKDIVYTVEEEVPAGYTASYAGSAEHGYVITNTHTPETTIFSAEKKWDDSDNQDGKRPAAVVVHLLANGEHTEQKVTLSEENGWKVEWTDLEKFSGGTEIVYTVMEEPVEGYVASYNRNGSHVVITNTYAPEKTELVVEKVWHDNDNQDGLRQAVEVELYANGQPTGMTAVLSAENSWIHAFMDLDKYADGEEIVYTAVELVVPDGYTVRYVRDDMTGVYEIVNTHIPATTSLTVNKVWNDANNQDGIRPTGIVVTLYADGISTGKNALLDASNNWTYTFTDLPANSYGTQVIYSVEEQAARGVPGYTGEIRHNEDGSITIINTHIPETTYIVADKKWDDEDNKSGMRPGSVVVHLLANGEHTGKQATLSVSNNWNHQWSDLQKYEGGIEIVYTVLEEPVELYTAVYVREGNHVTITNTYAPGLTDLTVLKVWHDNNDQDGLRQSVQVELLANGKPTGRRATLSAENNWKYEFIELEKYAEGELIEYTVAELEIPDGYTVSYKRDDLTGIYEVINTHVPQNIYMTVEKKWDDADNKSGMRPASVVVHLLANGEPVGQGVTLSQDNNWSYQWTDLQKFAEGTEIVYTVVEEPVAYYTASYDREGDHVTITNTYAPDLTDLTVLKVWNDHNDQDGLRKSVQVELLANGEPTGIVVTLSGDNNWKYVFTELEKYAHGELVEYSVVELNVPDGYTVTYERDEVTGIFEVINTHEPETIQVAVNKVWDDKDNAEGLRPESIVVELYANNAATGLQLTLSEANGWKGVWSDLDRYAAGTTVAYTVKEVAVPEGYEVLYFVETTADGNVSATVNNAVIYNPGTGDNAGITGYILLAFLSMAGFIALNIMNNKKKTEV